MPVQSQHHARGQVMAFLKGTFHRCPPPDAPLHMYLAGEMAACIFGRFRVGPFDWSGKHVRWFFAEACSTLEESDRAAYLATAQLLGENLLRWPDWRRKIARTMPHAASDPDEARAEAEALVSGSGTDLRARLITFLAGEMAQTIWRRFAVPPSEWRRDHLSWFFRDAASGLGPEDRAAYCEAATALGDALGRSKAWRTQFISPFAGGPQKNRPAQQNSFC